MYHPSIFYRRKKSKRSIFRSHGDINLMAVETGRLKDGDKANVPKEGNKNDRNQCEV